VGLANLGRGLDDGSGYGANSANLMTGAANARAGAQMYGPQAYGNAFGTLANLGGYYAGMYQNRNRYPVYGPGN
jgi:hypothetical protein